MTASKSRLSTLLIYGLLVVGSAVFSLPFLWMVATSVKVDRELFTERLHILPIAPQPVSRSPHIDLRQFRDLAGPKQKESLAILRDQLSTHASSYPLEGSVEAAADTIYQNLVRTSPAAFWDSADREKKLRAAADAASPGEAILPALREFGLGSLQLMGQHGQEMAALADRPAMERWDVSAPGAHVELARPADSSFPGAAVHYDFQRSDRIVLWKNLGTPFAPDEFFGLRLSILPDDSWHRLTIYVKSGDRWLVARRAFYLAYTSSAATEVTWQVPGEADVASQFKSWLLLDPVPEPPADLKQLAGAGQNGLSLFIVMDRSTPLQAWWGKISRNYLLTFTTLPFWRYFTTSVFVTALNIIFSIFSCSMVAFAFSRLTWPGRDTLFAILLATMMVPAQVTMIPQFMIYKALGLYNTLTPLWIGAVFANAFFVFLMRQFMKAIPRDLEDAARIDGCGFWGLYWQIMMPLVRPALATIAIFTFLASWNDFMTPLIYLSDERLYTLSLGLFSFRVQIGTGGDQALLMAGCFLMLLPVILLFFFAQRYFIQGVTLTGMK